MKPINKGAAEMRTTPRRRAYTPEEFLTTMRGQYIVSQALNKAIEALEAVEPEIMREVSNIDDMKFLRDELFNVYVSDERLAWATGQADLIRKEVDTADFYDAQAVEAEHNKDRGCDE